MAFVMPREWTEDEVAAAIAQSRERFSESRKTEGVEYYVIAFDSSEEEISRLFDDTDDLRNLEEAAFDLLSHGRLKEVRYLSSPVISEDDLKTLSGVESLSRSSLRNKENVERVMGVILASLDPKRFPWMAEGRQPTEKERWSAIVATSTLMAGQKTQTNRRSIAKERQEGSVASLLSGMGFSQVKISAIRTLNDAPKHGEFCRETTVSGKKADLVVGLADGRFLAIECKVSNSEVNSFKRLNHETVEKAKHWSQAFGTNGVVCAAVLSGVYKLSNVLDAQSEGVSIFWAHDLSSLRDYIASIDQLKKR